MDLSVLRTITFGLLGKLESAGLQVLNNVFTSAYGIVAAAKAATLAVVDVTFSLARNGLRAVERLTYEVVVFAFSVLNAAVAAIIGRPELTFGLTKTEAQEVTPDAQV